MLQLIEFMEASQAPVSPKDIRKHTGWTARQWRDARTAAESAGLIVKQGTHAQVTYSLVARG